MTIKFKIFFILSVLIAFAFGPFAAPLAAAPGPGNVTAVLKDSSTGEAVAFATVSLTVPGKKTAYKYILSDEGGKVLLQNVKNGQYEFKSELLGYKPFVKTITVKDGNLDLGEVKMDLDKETLDAAEVSAVGNPITIKKDTIEYNAASFKTTDNDVLLDLLKKLPGVEVSDEGAVTVNGKSISKITVGGKTFFLNDPQMATNNIPANVIEKVKVLQKKSEQAEFTGIDDGEEETVIDLSLKQGARNGGIVGNISAGIGHDLQDWGKPSEGDWRYQANVFTGKFSDKGMVAVISNSNNVNSRGFGDFSGNMMRGMGGGAGGGTDAGITNSWMLGANTAWNLFDDRMKLGGNYANNGSRSDVETRSHRVTYREDGSNLIYDNSGSNSTNSYGNRIGMELDHKFSDNTSILFRPQLNWGHGNFHNLSRFTTLREKDGDSDTTNTGFNGNTGSNKNWTTSGMALLRQKLGIPGRTLSLRVNYNFSNNEMEGFNQSLTSNHMIVDGEKVVRDSIINQRYDQNSRNRSISSRLTYTEPLGNNWYASANYEFRWNSSTSRKDTYDGSYIPPFDADHHIYDMGGPESFNVTYSNEILNRHINQRIGADLMYQSKKLHAQVGLGVNPNYTHNETTRDGNTATYDSHVVNFAPTANLFYDIDDNTNMRFYYRGNSNQPSVSQLMPVPNNSNPMHVSFGNPSLKPYFDHSIRYEFRRTNRQKFSTVTLNFNGGMTQNPIVNASWYGTNGAQYSMPVNGRNSMNMSLRGFYNTPIAKSNFSISNQINASYSVSHSYVGKVSFDVDKYYRDGEFDYDGFLDDHSDFDDDPYFTPNTIQSFNANDRLRVTYRNKFVEIEASGRTRARKSWYTISSGASTSWTWNNSVGLDMDWTIAKKWELESELSYNWYNGYSVKQDDEYIANASVSRTFNRFTLMLKMYDIFNQSKALSITDSANYHLESFSNTLGRYIMLSLTMRFGNYGRRGGRPGMGGPGGGQGGRGMGGPPGGMGGPPGGGR